MGEKNRFHLTAHQVKETRPSALDKSSIYSRSPSFLSRRLAQTSLNKNPIPQLFPKNPMSGFKIIHLVEFFCQLDSQASLNKNPTPWEFSPQLTVALAANGKPMFFFQKSENLINLILQNLKFY